MNTLAQLQSGELAGTKRIKLSCGLTSFPEEIFQLADSLEILDLSGNQLSTLPLRLPDLKNLKILFLSENNFTVFPEVLAQCPHLEMIGFKSNRISSIGENAIPLKTRWLILTNNQIENLPRSIGKCSRLQKVMLAGNRLKNLPEEMAACKNIELLRIAANQLTSLPQWLFTLPRLTWLAFSGNKFNKQNAIENDLPSIGWNKLQIEETLGEGASGVIVKAIWSESNFSREVAVKIFKGEVTSDGLPEDEMKACIVAGNHPNLTKVLGKISHHPNNKNGLVLDLISPSFKNLGGPPDFTTCTRDVFPTTAHFSVQQIIRVVSGIADVCVQLHSKGIMHGDLYAHNILIDENATPLLSDFGAACFYDNKSLTAKLLEGLEVRAFGCLLDDLLSHCQTSEQHSSLHILEHLRSDCINENISARPDFITIQNRLNKIHE